MDDLDDLLDDIEKSLNEEDTKLKKGVSHRTSPRKLKTPPRSQSSQFVEDDLSDILDDDFPPLSKSKKPVYTQYKDRHVTTATGSTKTKCRTVFIGGSNYTSGQASLKEKRTCSNLRCTNCDFKVIQIDDCEWHSSVDYLFLRNNMPDFNRIKKKLVKNNGSRAYACQCSWYSATTAVEIKPALGLKWVCGRH